MSNGAVGQWVRTLYRELIKFNPAALLGEDPDFDETPRRVWASFEELLYGHSPDAHDEIDQMFSRTFPITQAEMVTVLGVKASGVCPHHLLPVLYSIDFAYIPRDRVIGLSKVPRIIRILASRAVLHEQLTTDIAELFFTKLSSRGVAVVVHGFHTCMSMRGVEAREATVVGSAMRGVFFDNEDSARDEFMSIRQTQRGLPWA